MYCYYLIIVHLTMSEKIFRELGSWESISRKTPLNHPFEITRIESLIYFRIQTLDPVYVSCENKDNIEVDYVLKDNGSTSESILLKGWVIWATNKANRS